jgi:hypothetical protein
MKRIITLLVFIVMLFIQPVSALAQTAPTCAFQPDGSIICTTSGGGGGGGNNDSSGGNNNNIDNTTTCTPGIHMAFRVLAHDASTNTCTVHPIRVDNCTGTIVGGSEQIGSISCHLPNGSSPPQHPCTSFSVGSGGVTCENSGWNIRARVTFPEIYLDVSPYPATLVRWPTLIRNGGLPPSSGSGDVNYISNGGGSASHPQVGDWQNLRLILTLRPAGSMFVTLPHVGDLILQSQGATGNPMPIQWEVPSHPAVGGGPLAGSISGLDELPSDIPMFVGRGRAPYQLFWELRYQQYEAIEGCVPGPNRNGNYNCGGGTGHREITGYEWRQHSSSGEIPPAAVQDLPAALMADINQDGTPDAYWNNNLTLRRMDEANRVNHPQYQRSWNWGGIIYWAVREGQGQIGWPGQ